MPFLRARAVALDRLDCMILRFAVQSARITAMQVRRMATVTEDIPEQLRPAALAALAWVNEEQARDFKLTGLVDVEEALAASADEAVEFGLVLCEDEMCLREQGSGAAAGRWLSRRCRGSGAVADTGASGPARRGAARLARPAAWQARVRRAAVLSRAMVTSLSLRVAELRQVRGARRDSRRGRGGVRRHE